MLKAPPRHRYLGVDVALRAWAALRRLARALDAGVVAPFNDCFSYEPLEMDNVLNDRRAALLPAAALPQLKGRCDLLVNVKSFQEMEPDIVANCVTEVRRPGARWALMLNSRGDIGPDSRRGKPGTRERVTVDSTVAAFGTARRIESPWLDWRHSDNDQELTVLDLCQIRSKANTARLEAPASAGTRSAHLLPGPPGRCFAALPQPQTSSLP